MYQLDGRIYNLILGFKGLIKDKKDDLDLVKVLWTLSVHNNFAKSACALLDHVCLEPQDTWKSLKN